MKKDSLRAKISEAVEWAEAHSPQGEYLPINRTPQGYPFSPTDLFDEDIGDLRAILEDELLCHPGSTAVRFTSILIPYLCSTCYYDDEPPDGGHAQYIRGEFDRLLSYFVGLLRIEECNEWGRAQWEIMNCYAARDWGRARLLYERVAALDLVGRVEFLMLRAQFNFLLAFGNEVTKNYSVVKEPGAESGALNFGLDSLLWKPLPLRRLVEDEEYGFQLKDFLVNWCMTLSGSAAIKTKEQLGLVVDVIRDLSLVLDEPDGTLYLPLLARSYFAKSEFISAAALYRRVSDNAARVLEAEGASLNGFRKEYFSNRRKLSLAALARCYELANQLPDAVSTFELLGREYPNWAPVHRRIAELYARMGKYEEVVDCLRAEEERDPRVGENWMTSTILALGTIRPPGSFGERATAIFYEQKPDLAKGIEAVTADLWTNFKYLDDKTRQDWICGAYHANFHTQELRGFGSSWTDLAVTSFGRAVEKEIKKRVFNPWRESLAAGDVSQVKVAGANASDPLSKFVSSKRPKITLGQMYEAISPSKRPSELRPSLLSWARKYPALQSAQVLKAWSELAILSGESKHDGVDTTDKVARAQQLGRIVLEALATVDAKQ